MGRPESSPETPAAASGPSGALEVIRLEPDRALARNPAPAVRIFLGTEPAQHRAERIFLWSIEQVRDHSRVYEVVLMSRLPGFDSRGWTTGFTNYRFAIPDLAGGAGRAIYNDVDQVYTGDPAELFDSDLRGHGFLAISPADPSVMLLDCARMQAVWTLEAARSESKNALIARANRVPGLYGRLDPEWNTRDDELPPDRSKVIHFTTLHTQPWRPFPERFVYQANPVGEVWHELERSADRAGFQTFSRARPSAAFREATRDGRRAPGVAAGRGPDGRDDDEAIRALVRAARAGDALVMSVGGARALRGSLESAGLEKRWGVSSVRVHDVGEPLPRADRAAGVVCTELDRVPMADVPWVLDELARGARDFVYLAIRAEPSPKRWRWRGGAAGRAGPGRTAAGWLRHVDAAIARHPRVRFEVAIADPGGRTRRRVGGRHLGGAPPSVWLLADDRPGNTTQSSGLAEELGWPYVVKKLRCAAASHLHNRILGASLRGIDVRRSDALAPPWPDLVIAAGRRTAPVALWIREQSRGRTRLVQLGRKGADAAELFDLGATPSYCRLFPHPRRIETDAPLHAVTPERLARGYAAWRGRLEGAAPPRIAVLVGGTSGQYRIDAATARRLGEDVARMARSVGGSLLVTTSRRVDRAATEALCGALPDAAFVHRWSPGGGENPYLAFLALADAFVITGDSESMLAEASSLGRPLYVYPLPVRATFRLLRFFREWVVARARSTPSNRRGTPRPQQGLEYLCARAIDRGFVRPTRDLDLLHRALFERGVAKPFGAPFGPGEAGPLRDADVVAERVRALVGWKGDGAEGL